MSAFIEKVTSGSAEIIASGTVISYDNAPLIFHIGNLTNPLLFKINFLKDDTGKPHLVTSMTEANVLTADMYNFGHPLGAGLTSPIDVGTWGGKVLAFSFRSYSFDGSNQIALLYTFYTHE